MGRKNFQTIVFLGCTLVFVSHAAWPARTPTCWHTTASPLKFVSRCVSYGGGLPRSPGLTKSRAVFCFLFAPLPTDRELLTCL